MTPKCQRCQELLLPGQLGGLCPACLARRLQGRPSEAAGFRGRLMGDYEIISELGRGGMGVVYLARQASLDRLVALKVILAGSHGGEATEQRFISEAKAAAQLQHAHIVRIFETGRHDGIPFYSMELIEGEDLGDYVRRRRPTARQAALLLLKSARAVEHAHEAGIVHRDVKPSNILVDAEGEPHLTDFGIAMLMGNPGNVTRTEHALGSPSYMAPEQLSKAATRLSDVYSLGAVLYFTLTGRPPLSASELPDLLRAIQDTDPPSPRRLDASVPADLGTITLKTLAKNPGERYSSARAFAEDLERWLEGRPILARPLTFPTRAWSWCRRNRVIATAAAAGFAVSLAAAVAVTWQWSVARQLAAALKLDLYAANLKIASDALGRGDLGLAERQLDACPSELRDAAWRLLRARSASQQMAQLGDFSQTIVAIAASPDGTTVAAAAQVDPVRIFRSSPRSSQALPGTEYTWSVAFTPDGSNLITADTQVKVWDLKTATLSRTYPGLSAALSPDGRSIATCLGHRFLYEGQPGWVAVWDRGTGNLRCEIKQPTRMLAWSPDGRQLLCSDGAGTLGLYDSQTGGPLGPSWDAGGPVWSLGFSPDQATVFASGWSRDVRLWSLARPDQPPVRLKHPLATWDAAFSPDGQHLAVGCSDRRIYIWDPKTGLCERILQGHRDEVWSLAWESNSRLLSGGRDPRLLLWDTSAIEPPAPIIHDNPGYYPVWLPGDRLMVVHSHFVPPETVTVDLASGQIREHVAGVFPASYDAARSVTRVWTSENKLEVPVLPGTPQAPGPGIVKFQRDSEMDDLPHLLPAIDRAWGPSRDGGFLFWRLSDGKLIDKWDHCFEPPLRAAVMSSDGRDFAWGGRSTQLWLADVGTGKRRSLAGHRYEIDSVAFSPSNELLVSAGVEGKILMWNARSGASLGVLGTLSTSAGRLAFAPDGRILAALEPGVGIHLWHLATHREVDVIPIANQETNQWLEFSPEGHWLGTRSNEGLIHVFAETAER